MQGLEGGFTAVFSSDDRSSGSSHDFTINLSPNMDLAGADRWEIYLADLNTWYTWYNISVDNNNTQFKYSHDGGSTWNIINLTPGIYKAADLINAIASGITANGHTPSNILITANQNTQRFIFTFTNNYRVDFINMPIRTIFGAKSLVYSTSGLMPNVAKMTNNVNTCLLSCDLLDLGYVGRCQG